MARRPNILYVHSHDTGRSVQPYGHAVPTPHIPFLWPQAVAVTDGAVYVGDRLNRRIAAVKLSHAAEATVAVP